MRLNFTQLTKYLSESDFKNLSVQDFLQTFEIEKKEAVKELFNYIIVNANSYEIGSETAFLILKTTSLLKILLLEVEFSNDEMEVIKRKCAKSRNRVTALKDIETTKSRKHHISKAIKAFERFHFRQDRSDEKVFTTLKKYIKNRISVDYIIEFTEKYSSCFDEVNNGVTIYDFLIEETLSCFPTENNSYDVYYLFKLLKAFRKKATILNDGYIKKINKFRSGKISKKDDVLLLELEHIINGDEYQLSQEEIDNKYGRHKFPELEEKHYAGIFIPESKIITDPSVITIDPSLSSLKDAAVSIRRDGTDYILGIHITNVAGRILEDSIADQVARQNFKSFYEGPVKSNDMIDPKFGYSLFSLDQGFSKPCLSLYVRLSNSGDIKDYHFDFDQVTVSKSLTYEQADSILNGEVDSPIKGELFDLIEVSTFLKSKNKAEAYRKIKELIRRSSYLDYDFSTHSIISETMVLYNNLMAATFDNDGSVPFIYRVHTEPTEQDLKKIIEMLVSKEPQLLSAKKTELINQVREFYPSATYSTENIGHHGLGIDAYAHATSPGRRYPDLFSQRLYYELFCTKRTLEKVKHYEKLVEEYTKLYNYSSQIQPDYFKELQVLRKK